MSGTVGIVQQDPVSRTITVGAASDGDLESIDPRAGIPLGGAAFTREQTHAILRRGYRILVHGFDLLMLGGLVRQPSGGTRFVSSDCSWY